MTKIILLFWILGPGGEITEPQRIEGFRSLADCQALVDTLVEPNPRDQFSMQGTFRCLEVPK